MTVNFPFPSPFLSLYPSFPISPIPSLNWQQISQKYALPNFLPYLADPTVLTVALMLQCCICHLSVTLCIGAKRCVLEQMLLTVHRPRAYIVLHNGNWPIAYWQKNDCKLKETNWFWITSLRFHRDFIRLLWSSWHVSVNFSYSEALSDNLWWNLQIPWPWKVFFADACTDKIELSDDIISISWQY